MRYADEAERKMSSGDPAGGLIRVLCGLAMVVFMALWWDLAQAPWVMDDYFFHHHLARMSFEDALVQRLTGNWNFEFTQTPMYRPGAGVLQVAAHHVLPSPGAHRVMSLLLHVAAAFLALRLARIAGLSPSGSALAFCVLLLQPWAVEALAWPFSFYDPLAEALLLWALCCAWPASPRAKSALVALSLALSCKETMMPMAVVVAVLLARRSVARGLLALVPLGLFLGARTLAVGHAIEGLSEAGTSFGHALAWDLCVAVAVPAAGLGLSWLSGKRLTMLAFWAGLALLPGVHFSVQVAGTPVLLSPRYLYPVLFPVVLGCLALVPGLRPRTLAALGLALIAAVGVLLQGRLARERGRAEEARAVVEAFEGVATRARREGPLVVLGLSEAAVEPRGAFNGDLPWAIERPFLDRDLEARSYFAYPRWDARLTNRFADRGTRQLVELLREGATAQIFRFEKGKLVDCGIAGMPTQQPSRLAQLSRWGVLETPLDPMGIQALAIDLQTAPIGPISLSWVSERHPGGWSIGVAQAEEGVAPGGSRIWLMLGQQVDWLMAGAVRELRFQGTGASAVSGVRGIGWGEEIPANARAAPTYQYPARRFLILQERLLEPLAKAVRAP